MLIFTVTTHTLNLTGRLVRTYLPYQTNRDLRHLESQLKLFSLSKAATRHKMPYTSSKQIEKKPKGNTSLDWSPRRPIYGAEVMKACCDFQAALKARSHTHLMAEHSASHHVPREPSQKGMTVHVVRYLDVYKNCSFQDFRCVYSKI